MKQAILVVSFGTTWPEALKKNIAAIEREIADAFPGWEVRRAFTSGRIMKKLKERDGVEIDSVERALARLAEDGFTRVVVQPSHIINGEEFEKLETQAAPWRDKFQGFAIGQPLLTSIADYQELSKTLCRSLPEKEGGRTVVMMGHGSEHFANAAYPMLEYVLHDMGRTDVWIGTVEGYPALEQIIARLREQEARSVTLLPLMIVAGEHAVNDMAGDESDSWRNRLSAAGYSVNWILQGLGELQAVRAQLVAHAQKAVKQISD